MINQKQPIRCLELELSSDVQSAKVLATIGALATKGVPLPYLVLMHLVLLLEAGVALPYLLHPPQFLMQQHLVLNLLLVMHLVPIKGLQLAKGSSP
jgi:hypothetical protein